MSQLMDQGRRVDTVLPGPQQGYQQPFFSQVGETQVGKMSTGGKLDQSGSKSGDQQNKIQ